MKLKTNRLIAAVLAIVMLVGLLPLTAFAVDVPITELSLGGIAAPEAGQSTEITLANITGAVQATNHCRVGAYYWMQDTTNTIFAGSGYPTTIFAAKTHYQLVLSVVPDSGYAFNAESGSWSLTDATFVSARIVCGTDLELRFDFPATGSLADIGNIELTAEGFEDPVVGESMVRDINAITGFNSSECELVSNQTYWITNAGSVTIYDLSSSGTFVGATQYSLKIRLQAKTGYAFDPNATYTFREMTASNINCFNANTTVDLRFDYPATAGESTKITSLTLGGVTAPVKDATTEIVTPATTITGLTNCAYTDYYWKDKATGTTYADNSNIQNFQAGKIYQLQLNLRPNLGCEFKTDDPSNSWTLTGATFVSAVVGADKILKLTFEFPATAANALTINDISIPSTPINTAITPVNASTFVSGGVAPYTYSLSGGPAWLSINSSTGVITGTAPADAAAAASVTLTVTDAVNTEQTKVIDVGAVTVPTLAISESVDINIPASYVGQSLRPTINTSSAVSGGKAPFTYTLTGAPAGITIDPVTGVISGTPTAKAAAGSATLTVTDSSSPAQTVSRVLTVGAVTEPTVISDYALDLGSFAPPVAGGSTARTSADITPGTGYTIYNHAAVKFWATNSDGTSMYAGADFQPGVTYYLVLTLMPDYGYAFAEDIANNAFTLDDGSATGITSCHVSVTGVTYRYVVFPFPQTGGAIQSATVTVPTPIPGASATDPAYTTATTTDTDYTVSAVTWKKGEAAFTGKFVPGQNYTAYVTLTPKNVATLPFSAESTLTVNGEAWSVKSVTDGVMTFSKSFTVGARTDIVDTVACNVANPINLTAGSVIPANTLTFTTPADGSVTGVSFVWEKKNTATTPHSWVPFETINIGAGGTVPAGTQTLTAGAYRVKITIQITGDDAYTKMFASWSNLAVTFGGTTAEVQAAGHTVSGGVSGLDSIASFYTGEFNVACVTHTHGSWGHDYTKHWEICSVCGQKFGEEAHSFVSGTCECGLTEAELPSATVGGLDFGTVKVGYGAQMGQDVTVTVTGSALTIATLTISPADSDKFTVSSTGNAAKTLTVGANNAVWRLIPKTGLAAGIYNVTMTLTAAELATPVTATATIVVDPLTFTYQPSAEDTTGSFTETITDPGAHTPPACTFTAPTGKYFGSWVGGNFTPSGENQTFYPQWLNYTLTATFNENGGIRTGDTNVRTNGSGTSIQLQDPSAYGISAPANKAFRGWTLGSPSGTRYNAGDNYNVTGNESITFYAIWDDYSYTVAFDAENGTGTMTGGTGKASYEIPACGFTAPKGMAFDYWSVSGDETKYRQGDVWTATSDNQSVTFRAVYKNINFTVKYNANGGGGAMNDVNGSGSYILPGCYFTTPADKKNFSHWALGSPSGERYNINDPYYPTTEGETVTFYAVWINKDAQAPLTVTSKNTLTFGESLVLTATGGSSSMSIRFEVTNGTGQATWNGAVLTVQKVGTITVKAIRDGDANYLPAESAPMTITIGAKTVTAPVADTREFTYTGAVLTYNIGVSGEYRAKDNSNKRADANESGYTVTVELVDKVNTVWADTNDTVDKTFTFIIKKATPTITPSFSTVTSNGKTLANANLGLQYAPITTGKISWVLPTDTVVTENTAYEWVFTPDDMANYNVATGKITPFPHTVHRYDNACDTNCNFCGEVRTITHSYTMEHNATEHWNECSVCGSEKANSRTAHSGGTATCLEKAKCSVCGVEYGELNANNHAKNTFTYTTNSDQKTHTKKNECCGAVVNASEAHAFGEWTVTKAATETEKGEKKRTCVCGYAETEEIEIGHTHSFDSDWKHNDTEHWHECTCGEKSDKAAHSYDAEGKCVCGAEQTIVPPVGDGKITVDGFVFEVGEKLPEGAEMVVGKIDAASEEGKAILNTLAGKDYNSSKGVVIFDIHAIKDGAKVQPNGTITVTLDKPIADVDNYVIYHIKDDGSIETLYADAENGKVSFNISSFSNFVFTEKADGIDTPNEGLPTGAIVAIVIASVIIVAVGGFAIFWFVIKKKKFADLIAVFKK